MPAEATAHICPVREMHVVGKAFHILVSGIIVYDEILERYGFASDKRIHESCHFLRVVTFPEIIEKFPPFHLLIIFRGKPRLNRVLHAENIFMVCHAPQTHPESHIGGTRCQSTTCHKRTHA